MQLQRFGLQCKRASVTTLNDMELMWLCVLSFPLRGCSEAQENEAVAASWRIQLIHFCFQRSNNNHQNDIKTQELFYKLLIQAPNGTWGSKEVTVNSTRIMQGKNLQEVKFLERSGTGWEGRLFSTYFSQEL